MRKFSLMAGVILQSVRRGSCVTACSGQIVVSGCEKGCHGSVSSSAHPGIIRIICVGGSLRDRAVYDSVSLRYVVVFGYHVSYCDLHVSQIGLSHYSLVGNAVAQCVKEPVTQSERYLLCLVIGNILPVWTRKRMLVVVLKYHPIRS